MPRWNNIDQRTVGGFDREWSTFTQSEPELAADERRALFDGYFSIFPWSALPPDSIGADIGCGSGRWAMLVAPRVGHLHAVDAGAKALEVARRNLAGVVNVSFHHASVSLLPFPDGTLDFAYSLGVLHHVPDTPQAICDIARKLKPGAPFLLYLYYAFDNRGAPYRILWKLSEIGRFLLSRAPHPAQIAATYLIATVVYWPLARMAKLLDTLFVLPKAWPLAFYRYSSFYVMRTDAFDRFCTRLEQRFTRAQISKMLSAAAFENVIFSQKEPFWVAVATRRR